MDEKKDLYGLDALVIGAGFGGVRMMLRLQMLGFNVKIFEQNETLGGLWYWHLYPGHPGVHPNKDFRNADSMYDEDMWKDWTWTHRFPERGDICHRQYFGSVDRLRELSKDVYFNSKVIKADWDSKAKKWVVKTKNGLTARAQYLIACNGLFNKRYIPSIKGINRFSGPSYHTAAWPKEGVDLKGKRVAVIGTGASGLQCIEDIHRSVRQLTVYHGIPSLCLPTRLSTQQTERSPGKQPERKEGQDRFDKSKLETLAGFSSSYVQRAAFSGDASMRLAFFEGLWRMGGFYFWLANYIDLLFDRQPNDPLYKFWREKSREHMKAPVLAENLEPFKVPHTWETKRPSPVSALPEVFKRKKVVNLIDVSENPVIEVTPNGIETRDTFNEFDVVVLATGYDTVREGLATIDIYGTDKEENLKDEWAMGTLSYQGPMVYGYPNFFVLYHPHPYEPSRFCTGSKGAEVIGNWIVAFIKRMRERNFKTVQSKGEAPEQPVIPTLENVGKRLVIDKDHPYMGPNPPRPDGPPEEGREGLTFSGVMVDYMEELEFEAEHGYRNFLKLN